MSKLNKEILTQFFRESDLFKGIDTNAAVEQFLSKVYDPGKPSLVWLVMDGNPEKAEVVGGFTQYEDAQRMYKLLPNSRIDDLYVDRYHDDIVGGLKLFDVELDAYGALMSVSTTVQFITGNEDDGQAEDEKTMSDGSYIYKLPKSSYFATDENEAVSFAKMGYESNKYFQDHAEDGVGEAMEEFEHELALGLVRVAKNGRVVRVEHP